MDISIEIVVVISHKTSDSIALYDKKFGQNCSILIPFANAVIFNSAKSYIIPLNLFRTVLISLSNQVWIFSLFHNWPHKNYHHINISRFKSGHLAHRYFRALSRRRSAVQIPARLRVINQTKRNYLCTRSAHWSYIM